MIPHNPPNRCKTCGEFLSIPMHAPVNTKACECNKKTKKVMKVEITTRPEEDMEDYDYRDFVEIKVDGVRKFHVQDDEPEDSNLSRSFGDCYSIGQLMQMAYDAGKRGEELEMI